MFAGTKQGVAASSLEVLDLLLQPDMDEQLNSSPLFPNFVHSSISPPFKFTRIYFSLIL